DYTIRIGRTERSPNLPQGRRPYLTIIVNFAIYVFRIVLCSVQTSQTRRVAAAIRSGIPFGKAKVLKAATKLGTYGGGPVIAEPLTHCARFERCAEPGHLIVLNRM